MADDTQPGQLQNTCSGMGSLPPLVPGLQGTEASALQLKIKNSICKSVQTKVDCILQDVEKFTDIEKLYLYLKLPCGPCPGNEKSSEQSSMSSSRTQQMHAFNWIRHHLEEYPETSLPKQEVYDEYKSYCDNLNYHPLSAADFGKIMKNVFPNMKARRLGMRGKSKYCYSGLRKKAFVHMPSLPNLDVHKTGDGYEVLESSGQLVTAEEEVRSAACGLVCEWAQKVLSRQFESLEDLARFLLNSHYIGTKSVAALTVMTGSPTGVKIPVQTSAFVPTADAHAFQPQVKTLASPTVDAKQQLQRKIQKKQQEQKLNSPLPNEGHQARRADSVTPGPGSTIACGSPALLSPQPTIGIVVAAVPSPVTVPRSGQIMTSPSPVPMTTSEGKVLPVNFKVVTPVQQVRQSPKTPQNVPASPVGDRSARYRYAQILPKPTAATGALTLCSPPTLLITNSPIKTVMPTPHVVKMTAISLGSSTSGGSGCSNSTGITTTAAATTATVPLTPTGHTSISVRPASASLMGASQSDDHKPGQPTRSGSALPMLSPMSRRSETPASASDVKNDNNAASQGGQPTSSSSCSSIEGDGANRLPNVPQDREAVSYRGVMPRAASVPTPLAKPSPGYDVLTGAKHPGQGLFSTSRGRSVEAASASNNSGNNSSTLFLRVSNVNTSTASSSSSTSAVATAPSASRSPRKRLGSESSPSPVRKVFVSQQPGGATRGVKPMPGVAAVKGGTKSGTPARPESAPASADARIAMPMSSVGPTRTQTLSDSPALHTGFHAIAEGQHQQHYQQQQPSHVQHLPSGAKCESTSVSMMTPTRSASAGQMYVQQHMNNPQAISADAVMLDANTVNELESAIWAERQREAVEHQQEQQQQQQIQEQQQQNALQQQVCMAQPMSTSMSQTPTSGHLGPADFGAPPPNVEFNFPFHDDDMTQDSIVEELVQMEEQMKQMKAMQQSLPGGTCVDVGSLQGQVGTMPSAMMTPHPTGTPFFPTPHGGSTTPIHTPTPTPTPTSEMVAGTQGLTRESPCSRLAPTTPIDGTQGSSRRTPIGTPHSNCSSSVPPSPVECRNPFAFTPINSSITGYHDGSSIMSSSPVKPMQRPMATHPDKAKLEWMNNGYNSGGSGVNTTSSSISILPSYQDLVDDQFRKPHAFAIPGQSYQSPVRHHDAHISRLTPISPVQQQVASMSSLSKQEGFAVPAPLDGKTSTGSGSGTFRCRSVSPAVRQRNLSGNTSAVAMGTSNTGPNVPRSVISPFNSPVTPEVLNIFANRPTDASGSGSMAQRSQSVPLSVMMQTEVLPPAQQVAAQQQVSTGNNITNVLLSKMDGNDGDELVRGLGINSLPSNYTARMNLTQILETSSTSFSSTSANHQALVSSGPTHATYEFQKPGYLMKNARGEPVTSFMGSGAVGRMQQLLEEQHREQQQQKQQQQQQNSQEAPEGNQPLLVNPLNTQQLDFNNTLDPTAPIAGQASGLNAVGSDFSNNLRLNSDLSSSINDLNTLDPNLLFDPNQQQGQYEDSTLEELKNDPLFQQICSDTVNPAGFDWLESKDQATVEMLG